MNKVARQYAKAVKRYLTCPAQYRNKYLDLLEKDVEACLEENPDASFHDMETFLGPAKTVAESYLEEIPPDALSAYARERKRKKWIVIIGIAVSIVLLIVLVLYIGSMHTSFAETIYAPKDANISSAISSSP